MAKLRFNKINKKHGYLLQELARTDQFQSLLISQTQAWKWLNAQNEEDFGEDIYDPDPKGFLASRLHSKQICDFDPMP
jgi:hypothetical protein